MGGKWEKMRKNGKKWGKMEKKEQKWIKKMAQLQKITYHVLRTRRNFKILHFRTSDKLAWYICQSARLDDLDEKRKTKAISCVEKAYQYTLQHTGTYVY